MPIAVLVPNGAGDLAEWTPSAGTNWEAALETDALFIRAAASGLRDRYTLTDLPAEAVTVNSVLAQLLIGSELDNPTARISLRLAGVDSNGTTTATEEGGYTVLEESFALAPGGLAWTVARVNALQGGPDTVSAPPSGVLVDAFRLLVDYETAAAPYDNETVDVLAPDTNLRPLTAPPDTVRAECPDTVAWTIRAPDTSPLDTQGDGETQPAVDVEGEA